MIGRCISRRSEGSAKARTQRRHSRVRRSRSFTQSRNDRGPQYQEITSHTDTEVVMQAAKPVSSNSRPEWIPGKVLALRRPLRKLVGFLEIRRLLSRGSSAIDLTGLLSRRLNSQARPTFIDDTPVPANENSVGLDHELNGNIYRVAPSAQALSGPFSSVGYKSAPQSRPSSCLEAARVADRPKIDRDSAASLFPRRHSAGTTQFSGKAESLYWFRDGVLDFVYSSHLLEDYPDTEAVLREWLRVLKPLGNLIIFCPDEQVYGQALRRSRSNLQHSPCPRGFFTRFRQANPRSHWPDRSSSRDALDRHLFLGVGLSQET